jgi:hypothetical protein
MSLQINIGVTPGREYLLEFILTHLDRVLDFCNMRHESIITLFAEDTSAVEDRQYLDGLYDEVVYSENLPLYERYNDLISYNGSQSDYVLKLDMDSLVSPEFFYHYLNNKQSGVALIGFSRCYLLDTAQLHAKEANNNGSPIGSLFIHSSHLGRYFSEGSRDGILPIKLKSEGHYLAISDTTCLMDIKDGLNVWDFNQIRGKDLF